MRARRYLTTILSLFALVHAVHAQQVMIGNIDASRFPTMRAQIYIVDADGKPITGLSASDIEIIENGIKRTATRLTCPPPKPPSPVSLAMSIDISGSMSAQDGTGPPAVELGKLTARELTKLMPMPPSEIALQTCHHHASIVQDFTSSRERMLKAIDPIRAGGGNDFVEHLLNPTTGLLNVVKTGKYRRVAVVYTDAWWAKLDAASLQRCKDTCTKYGIRFYAVLYSRPETEPDGIKSSLRELAEATGGRMYDGVTSEDAARAIADELRSASQMGDACELEWESAPRCDLDEVELDVRIPSIPVATITSYTVPPSGIVEIDVSARNISFIGSPGDKSFTITVRRGSITIRGIADDGDYFEVVDYGGAPPPFTLGDGESRKITIRYTAEKDSIYALGTIAILTDECDREIYVVGGNPRWPATGSLLTLTHPNGGEEFPVGSDTVITWKGVPPSTPVALEYSTDAGGTWSSITEKTKGQSYRWTVPNTPSLQCIARVREALDSSLEGAVAKLAIVLPGHVGAAVFGAWSPDGLRVATMSREDKDVQSWDPFNGNPITPKLHAHVSHPSAPGNMVWSADGRRLLSAWGDWDCIMWDGIAGTLIHHLQQPPGNGMPDHLYGIAWSPDERRILSSGSRSQIIWDAATGAILHAVTDNDCNNAFWSADGSSVLIFAYSGAIERWDPATNTNVTIIPSVLPNGTRYFYHSTAWHSATERMAVISFDHKLILIDTKSGLVKTLSDGSHVTSLSYSPDGDRILCCYGDGRVLIRNTVTGDLVTTLTTQGDLVGAWSPRGDLIAVASGKDILVFKATTGAKVMTLRGHTNGIGHLAWSPEGGRILSSSTDGTARIWNLFVSTQTDTSDALWSIVKPVAVATDIDMGKALVGGSRDSLVMAFIRNTGTYPFTFTNVIVGSGDVADFKVVSALSPKTIAPGASSAVEFRFTPSAVGARSAQLIAVGGGDSLVQRIHGVGVEPTLQVVSTLVDFGTIEVLGSKDTTVAATIKNIGPVPVTIMSTSMLGPDMEQFEIVSGGGSFTLVPGEARTMSLRFNGKYVGRTSGAIGFAYDGLGSPAEMQLFGRALGGIVYTGDDSARAGDRISLALMIKGASSKLKGPAGGQRFTATLRFNQTLLAPEDRTAPGTLAAGQRTIEVDGLWHGGSDTLARIPMFALLGNEESTSVDIISFDWLDDAGQPLGIEIERKSGSFTLLDLCREGDTTRLYDEFGVEAALKVLPNPVGESFELEYQLAEDGEIAIELFDMSGEIVRSIIDGERTAGSYRIRVSSDPFPAGSYLLRLRTPTQIVTRRIDIHR